MSDRETAFLVLGLLGGFSLSLAYLQFVLKRRWHLAFQRMRNLEEVSDFSANPKHPRFEELRFRMAELIKSGRASSLSEAYELAAAEDALRTETAG
jgi:hypothetical protein